MSVLALLPALAALPGASPAPAHHPADLVQQECSRPRSSIGPRPVDAGTLRHVITSADGCWKVVNFWAGWCAPCRVEVPRIVALPGDRRFRRLRVITVNMDQPEYRSVAHKLLVRANAVKSANFQLVPPDFDDVREITGGPWNMALPLTLVIGPDGRQLVRHDGEISIDRLADYLVRRGVRGSTG